MSLTTTPKTPPATVPASSVVPFPMPMWGGGGAPLPGCCPPGGLDALMKCYCDIQQTLAFMSKIMQDLLANDPNVQAAMVTGLEKSGSNLPLIGVTDGSNAQPGQVGEWIFMEPTFPLVSGANSGLATIGTLQPGDWDCWMNAFTSVNFTELGFTQASIPAGFSSGMSAWNSVGGIAESTILDSPVVRCSTSVPVLIASNWSVTTAAAGTLWLMFSARRMR